MKKIVGILGMAAVLATGAFAADPEPNFVLAEFTGSAGFGWKADFADSDAVKMGMYNDASANLKFGFVTAGDKATTGDGIWGELGIKLADPIEWDAASPVMVEPAVETAKIHFADGDFKAALNILKPSIKYGALSVATATPIAAIKQPTPAATDRYATQRALLKGQLGEPSDKAAGKAATGLYITLEAAQAAYDTAVAGDGELWTALSALNAAKKAVADKKAEIDALPAVPAAGSATVGAAMGLAEIGDETDLSAGFGLELGMDKMFGLNIKLMDNAYSPKKDVYTLAKDKKFGMAIDANLLAVENLGLGVASTFHFDTGYMAVRANADYNFAINDKLYVKPAVAYQMVKANKDADKASNALVAGVLLGWGAKDAENELDFFGKVKFNEGVSVAITPVLGLEDASQIMLSASVYDQSLLSLLGLENAGTLKTAFGADMIIASAGDANTFGTVVTGALAYDVDFTSAYVSAHAGLQGTSLKAGDTEVVKFEPAYKFGIKVGSKAIVDNTDLFVGFELAGAKKATKAEVTVGSAINF